MSTNGWAPPGGSDDSGLIDRLEQMIAPSLDHIETPRLASDDAELPWLSGGTTTAIEPTFDVEGLPTVAGAVPAAVEPADDTPLPPATAPVASAPLSDPPPAGAAPVETLAAPSTLPTPLGAPVAPGSTHGAAPPPPPPPSPVSDADRVTAPAQWGVPDASTAVEMPSPDQVRAARESLALAPPRRGMLIALAVSIVVLIGAVAAKVVSGGDSEAPPVAVTPAASADAAIALPTFGPFAATWSSMDVRLEVDGPLGTTVTDLSGPDSLDVVSVRTTEQPVDPSAPVVTTERIATAKRVFTRDGSTWTRSPNDGVFEAAIVYLSPRSFADVVPFEARALATAESVQELGNGVSRYRIDLRTGIFATQYPDVFARWSATNAWNESVGERVTVEVEVDEDGLVRSTTIGTTNGSVTVSAVLSDDASPVTVPNR